MNNSDLEGVYKVKHNITQIIKPNTFLLIAQQQQISYGSKAGLNFTFFTSKEVMIPSQKTLNKLKKVLL